MTMLLRSFELAGTVYANRIDACYLPYQSVRLTNAWTAFHRLCREMAGIIRPARLKAMAEEGTEPAQFTLPFYLLILPPQSGEESGIFDEIGSADLGYRLVDGLTLLCHPDDLPGIRLEKHAWEDHGYTVTANDIGAYTLDMVKIFGEKWWPKPVEELAGRYPLPRSCSIGLFHSRVLGALNPRQLRADYGICA